MGTMIQGEGLQEADYRGERFAEHGSDLKGNNDLLSLTRPDIIARFTVASWKPVRILSRPIPSTVRRSPRTTTIWAISLPN